MRVLGSGTYASWLVRRYLLTTTECTCRRRLYSTLADKGSAGERVVEEVGKETTGWFKDFARSRANFVVAGGLTLLGLNFASTAISDAYYKKQVESTLLQGVVPSGTEPLPLPREPLRQQLLAVLQPKEPSCFYHIVTGPPGSGKSALVREVCAAVGGGVGYVDVSPAFKVDWGRDLGSAFNFRFEDHITLFNMAAQATLGNKVRDRAEEHPLSSLRRSAEALHAAAVAYKRQTGRPFILVIDSVDRLTKEEGAHRALTALLEYSREWAQQEVINCVFVTSDRPTLDQLRGMQPGSRAAPPLHIGHLTPVEGLELLKAKGVSGRLAEQCVGLVGGSLLHLERCAELAAAGMGFPEMKRVLLHVMEHGYLAAGLLDDTPQQEAGLALIEALLKSRDHRLSASRWRGVVPSRELQSRLLNGGVFAVDADEVTFESRLALTYAQERLHTQLSPEQQQKHKGLQPVLRLSGWWLYR